MNTRIRLNCIFFIAVFVFLFLGLKIGSAQEPIITEIQNANGDTIWSHDNQEKEPTLNPGKKIVIIGENFGPGPITSAKPGLNVPDNQENGLDLSKILFGNVRAMERNLRSYPGKINIATAVNHFIKDCELFIEDNEDFPDTWVADIISWSQDRIELTVPITAYEGPIVIWRVSINGEFIKDISTCGDTPESCKDLQYRDPNNQRVLNNHGFLQCGEPTFEETYKIARVSGQIPVQSNAAKVKIALDGENRFRYTLPASKDTQSNKKLNQIEIEEEEQRKEKLKDSENKEVVKDIATQRSAKDQFDYGEETFFAFDWNLGVAHLIVGIDWDGIFGFTPERHWLLRYFSKSEKEKRVGYDEGYDFPNFKDGKRDETVRHLPLRDIITDKAIIPFDSFGAIPLLPEKGADRLVAPTLLFEEIEFKYPDIYPVQNSIKIIKPPLKEGKTQPTGWVGYVYADGRHPYAQAEGQWIGFNCSSCHSVRVTYEYNNKGDKLSKIFSGIPNYNWRLNFLSFSGEADGLVGEEPLPPEFIKANYPSEKQNNIEVDKTLLIQNIPPGTTEATLLPDAGQNEPYKNDYFFSPVVIAMISNHTPVRRALSHSELLDGFEGAYLHGEEPDGTRGAMTSRALQDLTLFNSTLSQEDEILRRIGIYHWLEYKNLLDILSADDSQEIPNEGTFISYDNDPGLTPASFPPRKDNPGGLADIRDLGEEVININRANGQHTFAQRFPELTKKIISGRNVFNNNCTSCHTPNNGTWTNEDMHPISKAGGKDPVGRYFSPSIWQQRVQSIRVAILQNLYWAQKRGLLSDGHIMAEDAQDNENIDGLRTLVHPDRCTTDTELNKRLYTINASTFRIPVANQSFASYENFKSSEKSGPRFKPAESNKVTEGQDEFVKRHAYFTRTKLEGDDQEYYYWDYQKMRNEYGILEFGLDSDSNVVGGLPEVPHPWCVQNEDEVEDLVIFLLTL